MYQLHKVILVVALYFLFQEACRAQYVGGNASGSSVNNLHNNSCTPTIAQQSDAFKGGNASGSTNENQEVVGIHLWSDSDGGAGNPSASIYSQLSTIAGLN